MKRQKKLRDPIPKDMAARVLFLADRTCCVCRSRGRAVQIHHIDDNPANNDSKNLAVLCFECHRETQITGGFDRKLDAEQVLLYRDDWLGLVAQQRAAEQSSEGMSQTDNVDIELLTSLAEIYREKEDFELLAIHYDGIGNEELRDKYIDLALKKQLSDSWVILLRSLQGRADLIPQEVIEREYEQRRKYNDWLQRARMLSKVGRNQEAVADYLRGIQKTLKENRIFSAAFYLKELASSNLIQEMFILAFKKASDDGDLWWQVRALQELGWESELRDLLIEHEDEISSGDDLMLKMYLAHAKNDRDAYIQFSKAVASEGFRRAKPSIPARKTRKSAVSRKKK